MKKSKKKKKRSKNKKKNLVFKIIFDIKAVEFKYVISD